MVPVTKSSVNITSIAGADDNDDYVLVVDGVNNAIFAGSDAIKSFEWTVQSLRPAWTGITCQTFDEFNYVLAGFGWKFLDLPLGRREEYDRVKSQRPNSVFKSANGMTLPVLTNSATARLTSSRSARSSRCESDRTSRFNRTAERSRVVSNSLARARSSTLYRRLVLLGT